MQITLINCLAKLQVQGIDLALGSGVDTLTSRFNAIVNLNDWNYNFLDDSMIVNVPDGTNIPSSMSDYGEVVV